MSSFTEALKFIDWFPENALYEVKSREGNSRYHTQPKYYNTGTVHVFVLLLLLSRCQGCRLDAVCFLELLGLHCMPTLN